jgi:adenylylsulfate kinase-like enzyme
MTPLGAGSSPTHRSRAHRAVGDRNRFHLELNRLCHNGRVSVIFLTGPIGAGKTAVAQELLQLLPSPLSYIEGDTFWSYIRNAGERGMRETFPVLMRSMTAAAVPLARSGFQVLIDFSIPPAYVNTARKILKEIPFDFVLLRPSLQVCVERASSREKGAITDHAGLKDFYALFQDESGGIEPICDDSADAASLARRIAEGLDAGRFRVA